MLCRQVIAGMERCLSLSLLQRQLGLPGHTYMQENIFLPVASSVHGRRTDDLFWFSMGILTIPFAFVNFLIFFFAWKYQYKKGIKASFYPDNHKLELIWTIIPAIVMAMLVFTGWKAWSDITSDAPLMQKLLKLPESSSTGLFVMVVLVITNLGITITS